MVYIFNSLFITRVVFSIILTSFTLNSVPQLHSNEPYCGFNDAWVLMKITKLVDNLKSNKTNTNKMIDTFVDILLEGKNAYGLRLDLDGAMNHIVNQLQAQKTPIPKEHFAKIKDRIRGRMKVVKCQLEHIDAFKDVVDANFDDFQVLWDGIEFNTGDKPKQEDLPPQLVWGVCVSLTGIFLVALPIPVCKQWGAGLILMGVQQCSDAICKEIDEKKKNP